MMQARIGRRWLVLAGVGVVAAMVAVVSAPRAALASPAQLAGDLAVVPVQVTYVLRSLTPTLDSVFPRRDSLDQAACLKLRGMLCHQYVYERDPMQISAAGDRVTFATELRYRARVGLPVAGIASCGYAPQPARRAGVTLATSLYWRRDWRLGSRNTQLRADLRDQCRVTAINVDATGALQRMIDRQLADVRVQIDSAMPIVSDLKPLADSLWKSFAEPTALDTLNTLWLVLNPQTIRVAPLTGAGPSVRTAIVVYARPQVVAGAKPSVSIPPLPTLTLGEAPRDFVVPVTVTLPFAEMERRATELLAADTATGPVRVTAVRLAGTGDSVTVALDVIGSLTGTLTLRSRLGWDADARELQLNELQWSLESRGLMSRLKATLAAPLIGRAIRRATLGGRVPLGAQLDSVRAEMLRTLNRTVGPGIAMAGSVTAVRIERVSATASGFVVQARLEGQSGVWIQ
jgi:hypothetical protein